MADRDKDQNVDPSSSDRSGSRAHPDSSSSDASQSDFGANRGGSSSGRIGDRSDNLTGRTDRANQNDEDIGSSATRSPLQDQSSRTRASGDLDKSGGMHGSSGSSSDESSGH